MAAQWFCQISGQEYGPYSGAQLKQYAGEGRINPQTLVKQGEAGRWVAASQVQGLFAAPAQAAAARPAPARPAPAGQPPALPASATGGGGGGFNFSDLDETPVHRTAPAAAPRRQSSSPMPLVLMIGGGAVVALLLVALAVVYLWPGGGISSSAMRYLPDDSQIVASVNVSGVLGSKLYKDVVAKANLPVKDFEQEMNDKVGLTLADVSRVTVGGNMEKDTFVVVAELNTAAPKEKILKSTDKPSEEKVGGETIYIKRNEAMYFAGNRTLVIGSINAVRDVLKRGRSAQFSAALADAVKQLDTSHTATFAMVMPENLPMPPGAMPVQADIVKQIQAVTFNATADANLRLSATLFCKEAKAAESLQKTMDGLIEMGKMAKDAPPEAKQMMESLKISRSGNRISASVTVGGDVLMPLVQAASLGGGPMPSPKVIAPPKIPSRKRLR